MFTFNLIYRKASFIYPFPLCSLPRFVFNTLRTTTAFNHRFTEPGRPFLIYQSRFSLLKNINTVFLARVFMGLVVFQWARSPEPHTMAPKEQIQSQFSPKTCKLLHFKKILQQWSQKNYRVTPVKSFWFHFSLFVITHSVKAILGWMVSKELNLHTSNK